MQGKLATRGKIHDSTHHGDDGARPCRPPLAVPVASATQAAPDKKAGKRPAGVKSASDGAKSKLHPELQEQVESGSTDTVRVFATIEGDAAAAAALLDDAKVASSGRAALVVGKIGVQALPKLAAARRGRGRRPDRLQADGPAARRPRSGGRQESRRQGQEQGAARPLRQGSAVRQGARAQGLELRCAQEPRPCSTPRRTTSQMPGMPATPARASPSASSTAEPTSATPTCSARGRPGPA